MRNRLYVSMSAQERDLVEEVSRLTGKSKGEIVRDALLRHTAEQMQKIAWHKERQR